MPEALIFSKVQSRQRVAEVKAAVAYARELNLMVNGEGGQNEKIKFPNQRLTKNLYAHSARLMGCCSRAKR
jgi:hypothetical protein